MEWLNWAMSAIALTGTILNSRRNKFGFICWTLSNLWMAITSIYAGLIPQGILFFIYLLLAIYGIFKWTKLESGKNAKKCKLPSGFGVKK